jgi:uncharacterized protein
MTFLRLRVIVLLVLGALPVLLYVTVGTLALYQTGWLKFIAWTMPALWGTAWLISKFWKPAKMFEGTRGKPLKAPDFWTPQDAAAIQLVEDYRKQAEDVDWLSIADPARYLRDARALADVLAQHYHANEGEHAFHPLTIIEIFAVAHLAIEDLEEWVIDHVPGSDLASIGQLERIPRIAKAIDVGQSIFFFLSAIANPTKVLAYPLWRKAGRVADELQQELIRAFYQRYLRQTGFYLIEMYSGRLRGGSRRYREQFGRMSAAIHASKGNLELLSQLEDVSTTIAVMGQVKAGKSSLINALMKEKVAATSILPETREVRRYQFLLPGSGNRIALLDTPGYSEADVTKQQRQEIKTASEAADIVLLVMAANVSARETDVQMVRELVQHYRERAHLKPPTIIAVLTHVDMLRPKREWAPPYNWQRPLTPKEIAIAGAVEYCRELFGDAIAGYACVYTGTDFPEDTSVADEVVPQLVEHLSHGHSAAILKAFYQRLSRQRMIQLSRQFVGLLKTVGRSVIQ